MLGTIQKIEEVGNVEIEWSRMDGYEVTTDNHVVRVLISNGQSCCEDWGYMASEDEFDLFIGSELFEINLTDTALNKSKFEDSGYYGTSDGGIQFVDFVTSNGVLQLAVYNQHNGYYGHRISIKKDEDIIVDDYL